MTFCLLLPLKNKNYKNPESKKNILMTLYLRSLRFQTLLLLISFFSIDGFSQVAFNINSGNPNFPFPQFLDYKGGKSLASTNGVGVPHAELEQRTRDAYQILTNNMTYNINKGGVYGAVTVAGVKYIMPHDVASGSDVGHCTCVEGDGYYLLAAAYMADKTTFDGYYMWVHDRQLQKTTRFIDCVTNSPGYAYSPGISGAGNLGTPTDVLGGGLANNSAMDGDVDLAMALLVAWKQWGDTATICTDPCTGQPVTYKAEAIKYIKTMVDTLKYAPSLPSVKYLSGDIGLDGYHKGGDSWQETTNWATGGTYLGLDPSQGGSQTNYVDYAAPSYFRSFYEMLIAEGESPWCINQYKRAEASDDWLVGQAYSQGLITWAGQYSITGTTPTFSSFMASEDNRFSWRTHLNYLWNGAPANTWDPATHQYVAGSNTYELDAAKRMAAFLKAPEAPPYNNPCTTHNTLDYGGPPNIMWSYNTNGTGAGTFPLNWAQGTGSPSAVISGDRNLMAQMFRQCVIEWDQYNGSAQMYLTSQARYFHEWNRLLGMLVLGGNYHDPLDMAPVANMKVYMAVDKTYASTCDQITYTIPYRNYGKLNATGVTISDVLPAGLSYVSSTKPATVSGSTVTFNIGTVPGFITGGLAATMDSIKMVVKIDTSARGRLCNTATITCNNGTGWTSNEYPNHITAVMERNCVDILSEFPLTLTKQASKNLLAPGDTVSYTLVVKNKSVGFLNGGRPGVIVAGGNSGLGAAANRLTLKYRIYHGAEEAYINYKNYRVSYFMNKPGPPTWLLTTGVNEGCSTVPTASQQTLVPGPTWNHRFKLTFPDQIATITPFLDLYAGSGRYIHEGATMPQRLVFYVNDAAFANYNWTNDWSSEPAALAADGDVYWPIANDWTDPLLPNNPVLKYHPNNCTNNVTKTITKQLVEEWDGYTWRRIAGDAPVTGRELQNVQVTDLLPTNVTFGGFFTGFPTGTVAGNTITWPTISTLRIGDSTIYKFWVTVKGVCPVSPITFRNTATATATQECPVTASVDITTTCQPIVVVPPPTSMTKTANATSYKVGDPITYTIKYKNTHGAIINTPTLAADWNDVIGNGKMPIDAAGVIDINTNTVNKGMVYKYSHGTNGIIKGTMTIAPYQTVYAIILRHNGTTWTEVRFDLQFASVNVSFFNMPANTQIGVTQTITYSALPGAFDFQIQLNGPTASVWLVNAGAVITGPAPIIQSTIPVQAGYAGVRSTPGGAATLASWYTALDSGFNVQMTDPIPADITFTSAANLGSNVAGTVTWPIIAGPMLFNDSITYSWTGSVATCGSGKITNTAYMKMLGITPDPGAQVIVNCTGTSSSLLPGTISANQFICNGTVPAAFTITAPSGGTPSYNYQWQSSPDGITWTNINTATNTNYSVPSLTATTWYRRKVTDAAAGSVYTAPVKIMVYPVMTSGTIGSDQQICSNTAPDSIKNVTLPTGGSQSYNYQWQVSANNLSWTKITGATAAFYKPSALTATNYYRRQVVSATCDTLVTASVKIEVLPSLTASVTVADPGPVCAGENVTLVASPNNGGVNPGYQWYLNGVALTGETKASYTNNTLKNGDSLRVVLFSDATCALNSPVSSNKIIISISTMVVPSVVIISTPGSSICAGTPVQFSIGSRSGQGNAPSYKWFLNGIATGITDTVYKPITLVNGDSVKVEMTSNSSCATTIKTVYSKSITMQVSPNVTPDVTIGVDQAALCKGAKATFSVKTRANGGAAPLYQWQLNGANIVGSTDTVFSSTTLNNGDQVRLIMTSNLTCVTKQKDTSSVITITINPTRTVNIVLSDPGGVCDNTPVTFKATTSNSGTNPVFKWMVNGVPAVPAPAAGDSIFTAVLKNNQTVQVSVTSSLSCTSNPVAASNIVTMKVNAVPKAASFSYAGSPYCTSGSNAIPVLGATGTSGTFSSTVGVSISPTSGVINILLSTTGTYTVKNKVISGCGADSTTASITIQAAQKANFSYPGNNYCKDQGGVITPIFTGKSGVLSSKAGLSIDSNSGTINIGTSTPGTYIITNTIAASGACPVVIVTDTVAINATPLMSVSPDVRIATGRSTVLTANGGGTYSWSPPYDLSCTNCQSPTATPLQTTTYTVVADNKGCKAEANVTVTIEQCGEVFVPTAFSPNSSGQNSMECVYGNCIQTLLFMIFDRWGEKVFEANDPSHCWDGKYNGTPLNSGEFVYVLKISLIGGEEIIKKGNISLIR